MKRKIKTETCNLGITSQRTAFELVMNLQCDLRDELGLEPLPHWKKTRQAPEWVQNIYGNLRRTILKPLSKLKPKRKLDWRNYGRCIGIIERHKTFLAKDVPRIFKKEGFDKISQKKLAKLQSLLGEEEARQYCLRVLKRPVSDNTPFAELIVIVFSNQLVNLENQKQVAFVHLADQSAKTVKMFLKGISEGYSTFMNDEGEFSADDRRADIHLELIAWQYEIENIRKLALPVTRTKFFGNLKKLPEFKTRTQDWFNDVCKDIKLTGWKKGHPYKFSSP